MLAFKKLLQIIDPHRSTLPAGAFLLLLFNAGSAPRLHWSAGDLGISLAISVAFGLSWVGVVAWKRSRRRSSPTASPRSAAPEAGSSGTEFHEWEPTSGERARYRPSAPAPGLETSFEATTATAESDPTVDVSLDLGNPFCVRGIDPEQLLVLAAMVSGESPNSPLSGLARGIAHPSGWVVISSQPFDPATGWGEVVLENPAGELTRISAGDPEPILALCETSAANAVPILDAVEVFSDAHYRSVVVAETDPAGQRQILGVIPVQEHPLKQPPE